MKARTTQLTILLTPQEKHEIIKRSRRCHLNISSYIRLMVFDHQLINQANDYRLIKKITS